MSPALPTIPLDNPKRNLTLAQPDNLPHIGLVGDTYTVTITGEQTDGRFCVIDMHIVRAGDTLNIPANAPHQFHNTSTRPVRMLCICSPAGQEKFFMEVGVPVATRTTPPPKPSEKEQAAFIEKVKALAPKYHTELLKEA